MGVLADPQNTSCENQQYVQTEWTSPTLHVPRRFPSRGGRRARRAASVAVPMRLLTRPLPKIPLHNTCEMWVSVPFPLVATDRPHGGKAREQSVEFHWWGLRDAIAVISPITKNTSLGDVLCPAGVQNEDITYTHTHQCFTSFSHNVPTWTPHAAATLNIFRIHIEMQDGN